MTDIFVSYAREDRDRVAPLVEALEARGLSAWWDPTIAYGSDYSDTIETALEESRCVLVVWSESSVVSHWVREEAAVGRAREALVPVCIDDVQPPIGFRYLQTAELIGWAGEPTDASEKVLADIGALLERLESEGAADKTVEPKASAPSVARAGLPWMRIGVLAGLIAVALLVAFWLSQQTVETSLPPQGAVAVLPFENLTGNEQLSYVGPGLAAGLISELAALPGINVVGRSQAWPEAVRVASRAGVAEALGVSLLIEGEVHADGSGLRVDVSAVDGPSSLVLWSGLFRGAGDDLYELRREIVGAVTRLLSASLSSEDRRRIARGGPAARAFDFYLQGLERLDQADNPRHSEYAADLFRQAIRIDGDVAIFHAALSDAIWTRYVETEDAAGLAEAEREARRALELDAGLPEAHLALARVIRAGGQFAESIATLRPVLAKHPKPDEAFLELAHGYEQTGDVEIAADCYETATALGPDNWFNWNSRGVFLARQGDLEAATASFEKAAEIAPASMMWPRLNLVGVRILLGDSAGAIADYEASGVETSDPDLASNIATAYYFEGRFEDAVALYRRAVELDPVDHVNHRNLGDALEALERREEAAEEFAKALDLVEQALATTPRSSELLSARALYAAKTGACDRALSSAQEAGRHASTWQDHLHLAMAYALCDRREEALAQVRACLEMGFPGEALREQAELRALWEDREFLELVGAD